METSDEVYLKPQQCEVCESRSRLLRCGGCQVAHYCSGDHQKLHWRRHKGACAPTMKALKELSAEEASLRNNPGDESTPPRIFENEEYVGHFWTIPGTRDYMRARYRLIDIILGMFPYHRVAVQAALDHSTAMLQLNRSDTSRLRAMVPVMMLRLGRDQDAYDSLRWWATTDPQENDWGNMELPNMDTSGADVLEDPEWWVQGSGTLNCSHAATVVLIKLRLLFRLRDLQNAARALLGSALPREIVDQVRLESLGDSFLAGRRALATSDTATLAAVIERLKKQIWALYSAVKDANMNFWQLLICMQFGNFRNTLTIRESCSPGSPDEAEEIAIYNFLAWEETPGALDEIDKIGAI